MSKSLRILLVEDNPADADFIRELLPRTGPESFQIEAVARLAEALGRLADKGIDLVLLDLGLPDSQGLQTLRQLHQAAPEVPVMVLTGTNDRELGVTAVHEGAQDYLVKGQVSEPLLVRSIRYAVERHKAAIALQQSEEFKQAIFDSVISHIAVLNHEGVIIAVNAPWREFARANPVSASEPAKHFGIGTNYLEICRRSALADAMAVHDGILAVLSGQQDAFTLEYRCDSPHERRWFSMVVSPLGKPGRAVVVSHLNITEHKRAEMALRESEVKYRNLFECSRDALVTVDPLSGRFSSGNPSALAMFGVKNEAELTAHGPGDFSPERQLDGHLSVEKAKKFDENAMREGSHFFEWTHRRISGEDFIADVRLTRIERDGKPTLLATIRDITERKRVEASHTQLATVVEQAAEAIVITDPQGRIRYANPAFEKTSGYTCAEVIGKNSRVLKSGQQDDAFYHRMWEVLGRGEVWSGHFINKRKDGQLYEEEATISPVRDATGKIINYVAVKRDVTREMQLESQVRQSQKMEAIGTLAGGIAHDFNNVLAVIFGYASLLKEDLENGPAGLADVDEILLAATRAQELVQQILTFSRQREQSRRIIPLDTVVKEATKFLRASLPAEIAFEIELAADAPAVLANATQIYQVTVNLATNALHAMEGRPGQLTVRLESFRPDDTFIRQHPQLKPMQYARLTVADTGHGMDARTLERIYEPFFTTKPVGKGTGLGLAVVHGIVQSHDGLITVESEVGKGTTFRLYFPAVKADVGLVKKENREVLRGQGQKILVVDDETALAAMMQMVLQRLNYEATIATRPQAALELVRAQPARYDLVVTDLTMPQMNGLELAKQIRALNPDLPILLATGNIAAQDPAMLGAAGIGELLEKPVRLDDLAKAVHGALAKTGTTKAEV